MEKDRGSRIIAIVALCVAILGLSIGFAAFTKDLNIIFTESNVNINNDLDIKLLASEDANDTSRLVEADLDYSESDMWDNAVSANVATISSDRVSIKDLGVTFNAKGQAAEYEFYLYNNSEYDAYLKSVDFLNYMRYDSNKVCTALEGTTQSLVDDACEDIHIIIIFDEIGIIDNGDSGFDSVKISSGEIIRIVIAIAYDDKGIFPSGDGQSLLPNGDFKINFGDIRFGYSTVLG